jgi:DNA-binding winged helix-turn-helix (wHTH) protein
LEILTVLLERPGELVSKQELMARVWPNAFVEPANLTVLVSALRRTLRDGRDGNRFIINVPGRGSLVMMWWTAPAPGDEWP